MCFTLFLTQYEYFFYYERWFLTLPCSLNPSVSVQTTCLHVICCSNRSQISVNREDVTLCPCLPGSPDSPLNPLWPCRQEQQNSLIKNSYRCEIKTHMMSERGNNIRIGDISLTFMPGRPGCPVRLEGQALGHWKTQQPIWGHGRALPPGGSTDRDPPNLLARAKGFLWSEMLKRSCCLISPKKS